MTLRTFFNSPLEILTIAITDLIKAGAFSYLEVSQKTL
jgi:hypothetical protein